MITHAVLKMNPMIMIGSKGLSNQILENITGHICKYASNNSNYCTCRIVGYIHLYIKTVLRENKMEFVHSDFKDEASNIRKRLRGLSLVSLSANTKRGHWQ